jgi:TolB-like protein
VTGQEADQQPQASGRKSFWIELKERQVYQTAGAYAVIAWGVTEILDGVITRFGWPDWLATLVVILFVVGFPVTVFLAWVFDWTPQGIRREEPWTAMGWASIISAALFLVAGSAGLFWLINPSGIVRVEQVGVAVLPCRFRGEEIYRFRAEGVAAVIHQDLAHQATLRVPAFSSVLDLSARNLRTTELGKLAGVAWLVECRLSQDEQLWRIDASVVDVNADHSEQVVSLDVEPANLVAALESITLALHARLGLAQAEINRNKLTERYPGHTRSFDAYLQGEQAMRAGSAADYRLAREQFRAAQQVPGFELARVREADAFMLLLAAERPPTDRELQASLRAIDLMLNSVGAKNPELAELQVARMRHEILSARLGMGEPPDEIRQREWFERAVKQKPSYAEPYRLLAEVLFNAGAKDEAQDLLEQAQTLDPAR